MQEVDLLQTPGEFLEVVLQKMENKKFKKHEITSGELWTRPKRGRKQS